MAPTASGRLFVEVHAETAVNHRALRLAVRTGTCESAPDVGTGILGQRQGGESMVEIRGFKLLRY